jgi:hypothetical protein
LLPLDLLECRFGALVGDVEFGGFVVCALEFAEGRCVLAAGVVDDEVAGDRHEPGFELVARAVLRAALEDANPGVLKDVLRELRIAGEVKQVAIEAMLILLDEPIEHGRVATAQSARDLFAFLHPVLSSCDGCEFESCGRHTRISTISNAQKTQKSQSAINWGLRG